jgi:hypothetical protein
MITSVAMREIDGLPDPADRLPTGRGACGVA